MIARLVATRSHVSAAAPRPRTAAPPACSAGVERARLGTLGVGLGGVQQPGVHAVRPRRRGSRAGSTRTPAAGRGGRPPGRRATSRPPPAPPARAARRPGRPGRCAEHERRGRDGARRARPPPPPGRAPSVRCDERAGEVAQPGGGVGVARTAEVVVVRRPLGGQRVHPGQRLQRRAATAWAAARAARCVRRTAARADRTTTAGPHSRPSRWSDPSSTALACAPRSSDSAVRSGVVRRRPRSRSSASMPSRVAAMAEATPSRLANRARGSRPLPGSSHSGTLADRPVRPPAPSPRTSATVDIASRSSPSQSSSCWPTSRTHQASASDRDRATPASTRVSSTCRCGCRSRVITGAATWVNSSVALADPDPPGDLALEPLLGLVGRCAIRLPRVSSRNALADRRGPRRPRRCEVPSGRSTSARVSRTMISSRSTATSTGWCCHSSRDPAGEPAADPLLRFVCNHVIDITSPSGPRTRTLVASPRWTDPCTQPPGERPPPRCRSAGSRTPTTAPARRTPREAAAWLAGLDHAHVLELGAGTGKLTEQLRRARAPRARHRPARRDAAAPGGPASPARRRPSRPPSTSRCGARSVDTVVGAQSLPLVRPRPGAARDRPRAAPRRPPRAGLEPPRRADPLGPPARRADRHPGAAERPDPRAAVLAPVRLRRDHDVPLLAAARPGPAARPRAVPLQRRGA